MSKTARALKDQEGPIWTALLERVSRSAYKELPLKTILLLGDAALAQELVEQLQKDQLRKGKSNDGNAPVSFYNIPGSTFIDVEDEDNEPLLRIKLIYLPIDECFDETFLSLLPADQVRQTAVHILLDWRKPWTFMRDMQKATRHLKKLTTYLATANASYAAALEQSIDDLRTKLQAYSSSSDIDPGTRLTSLSPLEEGCFVDPLGFPVTAIAYHVENMTKLEVDRQYRAEQFDFIQQSLRTALLPCGGSLHYLTHRDGESARRLVKTFIQYFIPGVLDDLQENRVGLSDAVIDQEKVFIPFGWDSRTKIDYLRDNFDVAGASTGWLQDMQTTEGAVREDSFVSRYEHTLNKRNPLTYLPVSSNRSTNVPVKSHHEYLKSLKDRFERKGTDLTDDYGDNRPEEAESTIFSTDPSLNYQRSADVMPMPASPSKMAKSVREKDEFVQAFFQNLLSRSREE